MKCRLTASFALLLVAVIASGREKSDTRWGIATNAADWVYLITVNASGQYALSRHFSLEAQARWNPWSFRKADDQLCQSRQRTFSFGTRWWPWYSYSGWWMGARCQYQEYNRGGLKSPDTEEGDAAGLVLSGGYSIQLNRWLNIDLGFGFWGGRARYTTYACPTCGIVTGGGSKTFFLPDELLLSAMIVF